MRVELFVLNYNGAHYISDCIDSFLQAIRNSSHECCLSMIDNKSADDSVRVIRSKFQEVNVIPMEENRVLCSFNKAAARSQAEIVFLLSNDLKAGPFFIDPILSVFLEKQDVFLVASKSFLFDGSYEGGRSIPFMSFGLFGTACRFTGYERLIDRFGITFSAGFGAFNRKKFLELGGYDDLYLPGRMEDADLMFRAWKKGWKCYYQPKSILYHMGGKSFKDRFGERGTMEIAHRNTFLFMWKNVRSPQYLFQHFFFLLPRTVWMVLRGRYEFFTGFLKALGRLRQGLLRRREERRIQYAFNDRQVLRFFQDGC